MIKQHRIFQLLILIGTCFYCGSLRPAEATDRESGFTGRIIRIERREPKGRLRIRQGAGLGFIEAAENMLVRRGHLLLVEGRVRVTIRCGDGSDHDLMPGPQGCPCTAPCTPEVCGISHEGTTICSTRHDSDDSSAPTIISPRLGALLNRRPLIRWIPASGPRSDPVYTVSMRTEYGNVIWSREVGSKTELAYPADAPGLLAGHAYSVIVSSDPESLDTKERPASFNVLPFAKARAVRNEIRRLSMSKPRTGQGQFLRANLYAARGLYTEAIALLERSGPKSSPITLRALGDLYLTVGLDREAEKRYIEALRLNPEKELEERALLQSGLALVYQRLALFDHAAERLGEAADSYGKLGNAAMVEKLKKQMGMLTQ